MPNQRMGSFLHRYGAFHVPSSRMARVGRPIDAHYRNIWPVMGRHGAVITDAEAIRLSALPEKFKIFAICPEDSRVCRVPISVAAHHKKWD